MLRKPIEPQVAKAFVRDMRAFFKAKDQLKQDEIALANVRRYSNTSGHGRRSCG